MTINWGKSVVGLFEFLRAQFESLFLFLSLSTSSSSEKRHSRSRLYSDKMRFYLNVTLLTSLLILSTICQVEGQSQNREIDLDQYFTETRISVDATSNPGKCASFVLQSRLSSRSEANVTQPGWTLGVKPTVSLGTALIIFFGVGLLAIVIAFLFQMVSWKRTNATGLILISIKSPLTCPRISTLIQ